MKRIAKYLVLVILAISFSFINIKADSTYEITSYDVNIVVNENNKLEIVETIDTNFKSEKHGIIRIIPTKNNIYRADGTSQVSKSRIKINSISDEESYVTYHIHMVKENETLNSGDNIATYKTQFKVIFKKNNTLINYEEAIS